MKEMQELIEAAEAMLKVAYIEGSGWDIGIHLSNAISVARASKGGWIEVEQELPPIPEKLNLSAIVMGLYEFGSFDFMRYNKRTKNWRVLPDARPAKNNVIMWHVLPKLPSSPLSAEKEPS